MAKNEGKKQVKEGIKHGIMINLKNYEYFLWSYFYREYMSDKKS